MHTLGISGNTVGIYGVEDAQNYDIVYNVYHTLCTWLLAIDCIYFSYSQYFLAE